MEPDAQIGPHGPELSALLERCGCSLRTTHQLWSGKVAYEVQCPTADAKVRLLVGLSEWDSKRPRIIELARDIAGRTQGGETDVAKAIHAWVKSHVRFAREPRELFRPAETTIEHAYGDCDDSARVLLALLRAAGLRAGIATLGPSADPTHAAVRVMADGRWLWAETTLRDAQLGEHPRQAVRRTRAKGRTDVGLGELTDEQAALADLRVTMATLGVLAVGGLGARWAMTGKPPGPLEAATTISGAMWSPVLFRAVYGWIERRGLDKPPPRSVLLAGDSHAVGLSFYLPKLAQDAGWKLHLDARGGTSALQWPNVLTADLEQHHPEVVILSLGGNDFGTSRLADVLQAMERIAASVRKHGAELWWIDPRLAGTKLRDSQGICDEWRRLSDHAIVPSPAVPIASDGIHATRDGYRTFAREVAKAIGMVS